MICSGYTHPCFLRSDFYWESEWGAVESGSEEGAEKRPTGSLPDGRNMEKFAEQLHRIVHPHCRRCPVWGTSFFWQVCSYRTTAAVYNQGSFLLWATKPDESQKKMAALKIKATKGEFKAWKVTAQQRLFFFSAAGQIYEMWHFCVWTVQKKNYKK